MIRLKISHPTFALLFIVIYLFIYPRSPTIKEHIIDHCSESIEQEVSQAILGLSRRLPLGDK